MAIMSVAEEEGRHCLFLYKIKSDSKKKTLNIESNIPNADVKSKIYSIDYDSLSPENQIKKEKLFTNNNSTNTLQKVEKNEKTFDRFYNENLEYYDRPPISYEYCHLGTIERRNFGINKNFNQNVLVDNEGDSSSLASSSSIILSSGEASTATARTIEKPIDESITNKVINQSKIKINKRGNEKWYEEKVEGLPPDMTCKNMHKKKNQTFTLNDKKTKKNKEQNDNLNLKNQANIYYCDDYLFNPQKTVPSNNNNEISKDLQLSNLDQYPQYHYHHDLHHHPQQQTASENRTHLFFNRYYGPILLSNGMRTLVTLAYLIYLALAIIGCSQFREGLEPSHLVTADHYIARYFNDIKMFWKVGAQLHVAVLNPPNITNAVER